MIVTTRHPFLLPGLPYLYLGGMEMKFITVNSNKYDGSKFRSWSLVSFYFLTRICRKIFKPFLNVHLKTLNKLYIFQSGGSLFNFSIISPGIYPAVSICCKNYNLKFMRVFIAIDFKENRPVKDELMPD